DCTPVTDLRFNVSPHVFPRHPAPRALVPPRLAGIGCVLPGEQIRELLICGRALVIVEDRDLFHARVKRRPSGRAGGAAPFSLAFFPIRRSPSLYRQTRPLNSEVNHRQAGREKYSRLPCPIRPFSVSPIPCRGTCESRCPPSPGRQP